MPHTNNRSFTIFSDSPATIPHYIKLNYKNTAINLLIAIPDRRQACQTCGSIRHWTNQCQVLSEEAEQLHTIAITTANTTTPGASATQSEKAPKATENAIGAQQKTPKLPESKSHNSKRHNEITSEPNNGNKKTKAVHQP